MSFYEFCVISFTDDIKKFFFKNKILPNVCKVILFRLQYCFGPSSRACVALRLVSNIEYKMITGVEKESNEREKKQGKVTIFQIWINPFRDDPHFILHNSAHRYIKA